MDQNFKDLTPNIKWENKNSKIDIEGIVIKILSLMNHNLYIRMVRGTIVNVWPFLYTASSFAI